jgi:pilus assembly protein CpaE
MNAPLRTVIVESDAETRMALRRMLAASATAVIVGEFAALREAMLEAPARRPDVIMLEIPPTPNGADLAQRAIEHFIDAQQDVAIFAMGPEPSAELVMRVMRAGASEYLRRPVERDDLRAAVEKVARVRRGVTPGRRAGRVTGVFAPKGGLGVTTVAVNLAVVLAEARDTSALLVDLDTRPSDVATMLGVQSNYSILDAFENIERMDEMYLRALLVAHASGLSVLPGPSRLERFPLTGEQVRAGLEIMRSHFDHVVVDLRHDVDGATAAALDAADDVLVLTALDVVTLRATAGALAALRLLLADPQKLRVVVMREGARTAVSLKQARDVLGTEIAWTVPNDYEAVSAAGNAGRPVVVGAAKAKAAKSLRELAATILRPASPVAVRRGSFRAVFRATAGLMRAS